MNKNYKLIFDRNEFEFVLVDLNDDLYTFTVTGVNEDENLLYTDWGAKNFSYVSEIDIDINGNGNKDTDIKCAQDLEKKYPEYFI